MYPLENAATAGSVSVGEYSHGWQCIRSRMQPRLAVYPLENAATAASVSVGEYSHGW